jgi:hypothetical protein
VCCVLVCVVCVWCVCLCVWCGVRVCVLCVCVCVCLCVCVWCVCCVLCVVYVCGNREKTINLSVRPIPPLRSNFLRGHCLPTRTHHPTTQCHLSFLDTVSHPPPFLTILLVWVQGVFVTCLTEKANQVSSHRARQTREERDPRFAQRQRTQHSNGLRCVCTVPFVFCPVRLLTLTRTIPNGFTRTTMSRWGVVANIAGFPTHQSRHHDETRVKRNYFNSKLIPHGWSHAK